MSTRDRLLLSATLFGIAAACPAFAGDSLLQKKVNRRFPTGYCPLETRTINGTPYGMFFTTGGTSVHITFIADNFTDTGDWYEHRLDAVAVVRADAFLTHSGVTPGYEECYIDSTNAPALFSDDPTLTTAQMPFLENFDTSAGGFDLTGGAHYMPVDSLRGCFGSPAPSSAPVPSTGVEAGGGSLALGVQADGPVTRSTSIDVTGLTPGVEYLITCWWWSCQGVLQENGIPSLEIIVEGQLPTGVTAATLVGLDDLNQSSGIDRLVRFPNLVTGVGELVGSLGDNFRNCEALAVQVVGGGPDRIFAVDDGRLLELDPATGNGTEIGPIGFDDVDGIAFHPQTGTLYGVTYGSNKLIRIDITTGHGTVVANNVLVSRRLDDIAFHPDGRAFILTGGTPRLFRVDIGTGAPLQQWNLTGATSLEALAFSPSGDSLFTAGDRGNTKDLATIDLATSQVTFLSGSSSGFRDIEALAWLEPEVVALLAHWNDPTSVVPTSRTARLLQNVPNPFNPITRIDFELARPDRVELTIHDVAGRFVARVFRGELPAGPHARLWNGRTSTGEPAAAGLYYYTLRWTNGQDSKRMVLVK